MSNLSGLVIGIAVVEAVLAAGVFLAVRLFHQRKYRTARMRLASSRHAVAAEKIIKRLRVLALLDTMVARSDRLIAGLAGSAPRKQHNRKLR